VDYCEIDKMGYICQAPTDPNFPVPDPVPSKCDSESTGYRNSCYRYVSKPETHEKAEQSCKKIGGHLVSIVDSFEQSFLYNFIGKKSKLIWNGLGIVEGTQYLRWTDKQPLYYSNWVEKEPNLNVTNQICSFLDTTNNLKWNLTSCYRELQYVCETTEETPVSFPEVLGSCKNDGSSWIDIGDEYCYHVAQSKNHFLSWDSTFRYCISKGMKMLKTDSIHQIKSLVAYLWKEDYSVNIGLIRKFDKDSFVWVDGTALDYINWDKKEPNNYPEDKGCAAFDQTTGKWKAINCSKGGVVICQAPKTKKS